MTTYTATQARRCFSQLLNQAQKQGKVIIQRKDGARFSLAPTAPKAAARNKSSKGSPLDIPGIDSNITMADILDAIRVSRERG
ncbi:MAG: type II toxin-antitoxin system Phd/YefM family antitoxin [Candidatus Sumerlaeota bacterium]|nr:type II toxin-antitoxin system Phd/YefM family antitoxin [Candidatus Sumerlaeota bacterium]